MTPPPNPPASGDSLSTFEREVLASAVVDEPPPSAVDQGWQRLLAAVGPLPVSPGPEAGAPPPPDAAGAAGIGSGGGAAGAGAGAGTAGAGVAGATSTVLGTLKLLGLGFTAGVLVATAVDVRWRVAGAPPAGSPLPAVGASSPSSGSDLAGAGPAERGTAPLPATAPSTPIEHAAQSPVAEAAREPTAPEVLEPTAALDRAGERPAPGAQEEAAMLRRARAALRVGDAAGAFAWLEAARTTFPQGMLREEREALTIELLFRTGQREAAEIRARAFLAAHPGSAHAARLAEFLRASTHR